MKKQFLLILIFSCATLFAQEDAWVYFSNKPDSDSFFANPSDFLTQRSLNRRVQQNIPLDSRDVPVSQNYIDQIENSDGISVLAKSRWFNAVHVRGSIEAINALEQFSFVSEIDFANNALNAAGRTVQQLHLQKNQTALNDFTYGLSSTQIQQINGQTVHQANYTGSSKWIAVLDSGFPGVLTASPFQRLLNNNKILGTYNYVTRTEDVNNSSNHGTLVLSTMGGFIEDQYVGTAPDASYFLFVTEDVASENPVEESYWVEAAEEADRLGVDIINTSLGYFQYDNPAYSYTFQDMNGETAFISRGANIAFSRGMLVVVSAGNSGGSATPNIMAPADASLALSIGAVDSQGNLAGFSSVGPTADNRIKPDLVARGVSAAVITNTGNVVGANGTSFSAPIISGMLACLWEAYPNFSNTQIVELVKDSASTALNPQNTIGYGIPDFGLALQTPLSNTSILKTDAQFYPNPFSAHFSVSTAGASADLEIYSIDGRLVFKTAVMDQIQIDASTWSSGVYIYKIKNQERISSGKIIKK
jgi:hypothetical protein